MKRVLVMLVAAAMAASCTGKKQAESTASDEKVLTKTVPAALRVIEQNEVYTSEIEPYKENDITPAVSGVHIDRILVDVGSRVKAGQLLVTLDPTQYNQQRLQYQTALDDYNRVAFYSPNNVLVYYNRAALYAQLGDYEAAIRDYSRAIELYPDFANAYLGRSSLRYMTNDLEGSRSDKQTAERKIAEYRSKLNDSTFSIYADTSRRFNQLLSFESEFAGNRYESLNAKTGNIALLPMFKFSLMTADTLPRPNLPGQYYVEQSEQFLRDVGDRGLRWVNRDSDLPADTLFVIDAAFVDRLRGGDDSWQAYFLRGVSQSLIRQYTSSIANYTAAIDRNPSNPFLYINRSTTQIDFISSIDNGYQRIAVDSDPSSRLKTRSDRVYDYDEAIADLNKAAKLLPDFAYIYYNRGNLLCLSGRMPEAIEDYTRAIELNPSFGEAYYNRGLIQIYLKDTRKGCLDMSKAGELGVADAYKVLRIYGQPPGRTQ